MTIGDDCACEGADPTPGLFGGGPGGLNELRIHFPDGSVREWGSKEIVYEIPAGTVIESINGGGGGYGDPLQRDPERVAHEVREGLLARTGRGASTASWSARTAASTSRRRAAAPGRGG